MAAPTTNSASVLHPMYHSVRELFIGDETQTSQAASKFGWGVAPVAASDRVAFTMTYNTGRTTIDDVTTTSPSTTLVLTATNIASKTASLTLTQSSSSAPTENEFNQLAKDLGTAVNTIRTELAAVVADVLAMKKNDVAVVNALQALGILT